MNVKPMSKISFARKRGAPYRLPDSERKRLKNTTDAEKEANALADPDNAPLSGSRLNRMTLAREVRLIREKTGLSQPQFAARFHIGLARLRDYEQARSEPDFPVRVFLRLILQDPKRAKLLIEAVQRQKISPDMA